MHIDGPNNGAADRLGQLDRLIKASNKTVGDIFSIETIDRNGDIIFPLNMALIRTEVLQTTSKPVKSTPRSFWYYHTNDIEVTSYNGLIFILESLQHCLVAWYHENLSHTGITKLQLMMAQHFSFPNLKKMTKDFVTSCDTCQRHTIMGKHKYGKIPQLASAPRNRFPWEKIMVDGAGAWSVKCGSPFGKTNSIMEEPKLQLAVNSATNWVKFTILPNSANQAMAITLDEQWLCCYPQPCICGHNNGNFKKCLHPMESLQSP